MSQELSTELLAPSAGLRKTFRVATMPSEILQANVDKAQLPTRVRERYKTLERWKGA